MGRPGALLDIDGTLLDTNYLHVLAWVRAFRRCGYEVTGAAVHRRVGMGGSRLVRDLVGEDPAVEEAWSEEFHHLLPEVRALPGARRLVEAFDAGGFVVVLASSAPADDLGHFREVLGCDDLLAGATSSDDADASKPDPDIFEVALDRYDLDPETSWVVGDTVWDGDAARRAGVRFVGVESGGIAGEVLRGRGAAVVFDDAEALAVAVAAGELGGESGAG